ncbi:MAG: TIGR00730 family Rossman fold protein [Rhodobacter sp.]|nr:TIGR00730 family Rossman fold protein [Rhodobacter sp.]MCY4169697.1 TIGR00730 family Rossman fold protein [Rhodobacter sp.]MCY4240658.1 TIGR00730 family Rossman fold protein [Rhodobacter sp.]
MSDEISICVYCGARDGVRSAYRSAARQFGEALASEGWRLVYGAGDIGIMGTVASAALAAGGEILGVIPAHLVSREVTKPNLARLIVTENMHERKMHMFRNSQATVVLPGGAGSLEEFFEILTWRQLGLHSKPIHVLNTEGYWDRLIQLVEHVIAEGFADPSLRGYVSVAASVPDLLAGLRADLSRRSPANE